MWMRRGGRVHATVSASASARKIASRRMSGLWSGVGSRVEAGGFEFVADVGKNPIARRVAALFEQAFDRMHAKTNRFHVERRRRPMERLDVVDQISRVGPDRQRLNQGH